MMVDGILCHEKPSKGLVSRMRQLRGGGENQEDEEIAAGKDEKSKQNDQND